MILFYRSKDPYGFLSNLFPAPIEVSIPRYLGSTKKYLTSEHAYQVAKCERWEDAMAIEMVPRGVHAAILGHGLFDYMIVDDWEDIKVERMRECLRAKFTQHPQLRQMLLDTEGEKLAEDSHTDGFWGLGPVRNGSTADMGAELQVINDEFRDGKNMLGKLLMALRGTVGK